MIVFAIIGRIIIRSDIPAFPMVIGLVLEPLFEWRFAQTLSLSNGSLLVFFERPISAALIGLALGALLPFGLASWRWRRSQVMRAGVP